MKLMIAALALVSLAACNTEKKSVTDDSGANMPKAGCCESKASCSGAEKASCEASKGSCEASKSSCTAKPQG
ncbi:MAG: hypothetical protein NTY35_05155 [Planctomycetota bacterium]|nr:hypothetical protein [Planctomycetota bacterium]